MRAAFEKTDFLIMRREFHILNVLQVSRLLKIRTN